MRISDWSSDVCSSDLHQLRLAFDRDAHQPGARGLHLGADDRDLLPDKRVGERRFARIGRADDRHHSTMCGHLPSCSSIAVAAKVSASCFEPPSAETGSRPFLSTSTKKRGARSEETRIGKGVVVRGSSSCSPQNYKQKTYITNKEVLLIN